MCNASKVNVYYQLFQGNSDNTIYKVIGITMFKVLPSIIEAFYFFFFRQIFLFMGENGSLPKLNPSLSIHLQRHERS